MALLQKGRSGNAFLQNHLNQDVDGENGVILNLGQAAIQIYLNNAPPHLYMFSFIWLLLYMFSFIWLLRLIVKNLKKIIISILKTCSLPVQHEGIGLDDNL